MAIWTTCLKCEHSFSAQDGYLGKRVRCPSCGAKVRVLDDAGRKEAEARLLAEKAWQDEQERRIELIETMARKERRSTAAALASNTDRVRNYNPGAITRFRKLRALSRFMLLGAYLFLPLAICGMAACVYLYRQTPDGDPAWLVLAALGWTLLLLFAFFLFKFLGEMSWLLADLGDHQLDVRNLLLDLRDEFDRRLQDSSTK